MSIDREQHESCPQVLLSCSLRSCKVIQASEVGEFPGRMRDARLQLQSEKTQTNLVPVSVVFKS